jgi:hypothetical protein
MTPVSAIAASRIHNQNDIGRMKDLIIEKPAPSPPRLPVRRNPPKIVSGDHGRTKDMSLLDRVRACQRRDLGRYRRFLIGDSAVGWVAPAVAARLAAFPSVFSVDGRTLRLSGQLADFASRSQAVAGVLKTLREEGLVQGWRDEFYPVATSFHDPALMQMERAAVPLLGVQGFGVHLNGYVGRGQAMQVWVARRSRTKPTGPGKLDHIVAGGQPVGIGLMDNLVKECAEEAAMPEALARTARPAGFVSYITENLEGLRNDILFAYDIELPPDFVPRNTDGEIEEFFLWPVARIIDTLANSEDYKFNVALVIVDFLVRHGFVSPDEPDYIDIVNGLRLAEH